MLFNNVSESLRNFHRSTNFPNVKVTLLVSTLILSSCAVKQPQNAQEMQQQIMAAQQQNIAHSVPNTLEDATKNPPANLGVYSPFGTSTAMTANNTATQTTQNTPALATPFIVLQNSNLNTNPVNGVPAEIVQLTKNKKWDEALKAINLETKKNPRNVQLLFIQSRILIEQGQLESARQALNAFIEKYPEIPEPYNNLAVLYARAGKLDLARENLEMCIKLAPKNASCLQNLGDIYTLTAASYYDQAFKINRKMTDADKKRKLAEAIVY
jgi:Flp pilus assembly protein TadD